MKEFQLNDCCGPGCEIASDTFDRTDSSDLGSDWTEVSGGWEIVSNELDCTSAGIVRHNTVHPSSSSAMRVRAKVKGGHLAKLRVVAAYASSTSWIAAELIPNSTAGSGVLGIVDAAGNVFASVTVTAAVDTWYDLEICTRPSSGGYDNDDMALVRYRPAGNASWSNTLSDFVTVPIGYYAGISSSSSNALFDNFVIQHTEVTRTGCNYCLSYVCGNCLSTGSPKYMKVRLPAFTIVTDPVDNPCDLPIYSTDPVTVIFSPITTPGYDCSWIAFYELPPYGSDMWNHYGSANIWWQLFYEAMSGGSPTQYWYRLTLAGTYDGSGGAQRYATWIYDFPAASSLAGAKVNCMAVDVELQPDADDGCFYIGWYGTNCLFEFGTLQESSYVCSNGLPRVESL